MVSLPNEVTNWLQELRRLKGVPFNYLVPDPAMAPPESIRFFQLDMNWLDALLDGAFSLGNVTTGAHAAARSESLQANADTTQIVTGFLLRSKVVSGWPGLEVAAFARGSTTPLPLLRLERLAPEVMLCLFDGELARVDIHEPPEGLHFGVDLPADGALDPNRFRKELKIPSGNQAGTMTDKVVDVVYRKGGKGVIDIDALAASIKKTLNVANFTSSEMALEMVEGVGLVTFAPRGSHG